MLLYVSCLKTLCTVRGILILLYVLAHAFLHRATKHVCMRVSSYLQKMHSCARTRVFDAYCHGVLLSALIGHYEVLAAERSNVVLKVHAVIRVCSSRYSLQLLVLPT